MWEKNCQCDVETAKCEDGTVKCEKTVKKPPKCEKRTITYDVGTAQYEDGTVKCEKKVKEPPNVTKELSDVILKTHNVRIEPSNARKKSNGTTECEKKNYHMWCWNCTMWG